MNIYYVREMIHCDIFVNLFGYYEHVYLKPSGIEPSA